MTDISSIYSFSTLSRSYTVIWFVTLQDDLLEEITHVLLTRIVFWDPAFNHICEQFMQLNCSVIIKSNLLWKWTTFVCYLKSSRILIVLLTIWNRVISFMKVFLPVCAINWSDRIWYYCLPKWMQWEFALWATYVYLRQRWGRTSQGFIHRFIALDIRNSHIWVLMKALLFINNNAILRIAALILRFDLNKRWFFRKIKVLLYIAWL